MLQKRYGASAEEMFGSRDPEGDGFQRLDQRTREQRFGTLRCRFYWDAQFDSDASYEQGAPVYVDVAMAELQHVGHRDKHHHPALDRCKLIGNLRAGAARKYCYAEIFWEEWEAFQGKRHNFMRGTPLERWGECSPAEARQVEGAVGARTVEDLASLNDEALKKLGFSGDRLRNAARRYMQEAKEQAAVNAQAAELAKLKAEVAALRSAGSPVTDDGAVNEDALEQFAGWEDDALRAYITDHGGEADGRWKSKRLREEAAKLAPGKKEKAA